MGTIRNDCWFNPRPSAEATELERAKQEMLAAKRKGGFAYKQAKARYDRMLRESWRKEHEPREL